MNKTIRLIRLLSALILLFPAFGMVNAALPQTGKVYQIINSAYSTAVVGNGPTNQVTCSTPNADLISQRWLVEQSGNYYYLRSLNTGMYLTSSRKYSSPWTVSSTKGNDTKLSITDNGSYTVLKQANDTYQCMHCDASGVVVCWSSDADASHWTFSAVDMTQAEIDKAISDAENNAAANIDVTKVQNALNAIFSDKGCTVLQSKYASMSASQLAADANYKALPSELQTMVTKVQSGNWAETDADTGKEWDSEHAKKFRVQNYEPFSRGSEAASMVDIQAYTNMNNPTGIITQARTALYVMVDKAPATGATLYINGAVGSGMYNDWNRGVELKEGLNVIPMWDNDAAQFVYYTVNTYDISTSKRVNKVTDYKPIKIHIEGGAINGFFNYIGDELYTPDTNEDWFYYRDRARHEMFDLVGEYVILHFFLDQVMTKPTGGSLTEGLKGVLKPGKNFDLPTIMKAWDDFCFAERLLLGIQSTDDIKSERAKGYFEPLLDSDVAPNDFHHYFNNRMMGITMQGDLFMNATAWRTAYNPSTMTAILLELPTNAGSLWGPAHEYGHMNQAPMKFAGTTEISNNIFSNVAVFYQGIATSRAGYPSDQRDVFNKQLTYLENGTWGTTRMFWQLWLYYHVQGHNRKFYPTLYELLRQNPRMQSYNLNPRYDMLHFAKMCCEAAGEDLTDFFDAWGFFIPLTDYAIDDYSKFIANLSQADIDAVKSEIAAYNYPKNRAILFIDDRPGSDRKSYEGFDKALCGTMGGLKDFAANTKPSGNYLYSLSGSNIIVTGGKGGVGFIAFDNETGKLLTFANQTTWEARIDVILKLINSQAKLYAVAADGTFTEVSDVMTEGTDTQKTDAVKSMLNAAKKLLDYSDETATKVGWYRAEKLMGLLDAYNEAKKLQLSDPAKAYHLLAEQYYTVVLDPLCKIAVRAGNSYRFINRKYTGKALTAGLENALSRDVNATSALQQWILEDAGDGMFYIFNEKQGKYIQNVNTSQIVTVSSEATTKFSLLETATGYYAIAEEGQSGKTLHINAASNIVGWNSSEDPSQWQVILAQADERNDAIDKLEALIVSTEGLISRAGTFSTEESAIKLTASNMSSNARCRDTSYGDQFTNWSVLFDNNASTYFHSDYSSYGSTDGLDHYLQVDLGEGKEIEALRFNYTTRGSGNACAPKKIVVYASNDTEAWDQIITISNDLPSANNTSYTSETISAGKPYRYYRFMVTATYGGQEAEGHPYFVISEFGLKKVAITAEPDAKYPEVTPELMINAYSAKTSARVVLSTSGAELAALNAAYDDLKPHHDALRDAMDHTSIIEISEPAAVSTVIYDLAGRRINTITTPGLYIINGRKVLVK